MTPLELQRKLESVTRVAKEEQKRTISYIYTLADLIGLSNGRFQNSKNRYPSIEEAFPQLFQKEAQEKKIQIESMRIKQFAISFNQRFKEVKAKDG